MGLQKFEMAHASLQPLFEGLRKGLEVEGVLATILEAMARHEEMLGSHHDMLEKHAHFHEQVGTQESLRQSVQADIEALVASSAERALALEDKFSSLVSQLELIQERLVGMQQTNGTLAEKHGTLAEKHAEMYNAWQHALAHGGWALQPEVNQIWQDFKSQHVRLVGELHDLTQGAAAKETLAALSSKVNGLEEQFSSLSTDIKERTAMTYAETSEAPDRELLQDSSQETVNENSVSGRFKEVNDKLNGLEGQLRAMQKGFSKHEKELAMQKRQAEEAAGKVVTALPSEDNKEEIEQLFRTTKQLSSVLDGVLVRVEEANGIAHKAGHGVAKVNGSLKEEINQIRAELAGQNQKLAELGALIKQVQEYIGQCIPEQQKESSNLKHAQGLLALEIKRIETQFSAITTNCLVCGSKSRATEPSKSVPGSDNHEYQFGEERREERRKADWPLESREWEWSANRPALRKGGGFNTSASHFFGSNNRPKSAGHLGKKIIETMK